MRLCIGTAKGIVILDPARGAIPLMVLADPSAVWCMAQDAADPNLLYAGSTEHIRGQGTVARSTTAAGPGPTLRLRSPARRKSGRWRPLPR